MSREQQRPTTMPLTVEVAQLPPASERARRETFTGSFEHARTAPGLDVRTGRDFMVDGAGACVFCQRLAGVRWEDDRWVPAEPVTPIVEDWPDAQAFRPLSPVTPLHTLVVPKAHVPNHTYGMAFAQTAFRAAELARSFEHAGYDSNVVVSKGKAATQSVDHLHLHVIPRTADDGLMVPWGTLSTEDPTAPHECVPLREARAELVRVVNVHDDESRFEFDVFTALGMTSADVDAFRERWGLGKTPGSVRDAILERLRERLDGRSTT